MKINNLPKRFTNDLKKVIGRHQGSISHDALILGLANFVGHMLAFDYPGINKERLIDAVMLNIEHGYVQGLEVLRKPENETKVH